MSRLSRLIVVTCLIIPVLLARFSMPVEAGGLVRHDVRRASIDIDLLSAGQVEVIEQYELENHNGFRHLHIDIQAPLQGQMTSYRLDVAKKVGEVTPELFSEVVHYDVESGEGRAPFSYEITSVAGNRQRVQITGKFEPGRWVFRMTYVLQGAVLQTEDRAILRLRYFSTVSAPIPSTSMRLKLPAALSDGQSHHLIFISETPVHYTFDDNKTFIALTDALTNGADARFFLSVPASLFGELTKSQDTRTAEEQLESAKSNAERASARGRLQSNMAIVVPILIASGLVLWLLYFLYFEREGALKKGTHDFAHWPSRMPPALFGMLLGNEKLSSLVLATLLRLTNLRRLTMEGYVFTWKDPENTDYSRYSTFEVFLLHWFLGEIANGEYAASAIQVKSYASDKKNEKRLEESKKTMEIELARSFTNARLLDKRKSWYARTIGLILCVAFFATAIIMIILTGTFISYLLLVPGVLFFWSSRAVRQLSEEGLRRRSECRRYRDNLNNMSAIFKSSEGTYTDIEAVIIALPRAVATEKVDLFINGLKRLPKRRYIHLAHALLKIYDNQEPPNRYHRNEEYRRCVEELDHLKEVLNTSMSIMHEVLK